MAVGFIFGRSGTGKTSYCIKAVAEALRDTSDSSPLILLVPEQATYQAERAILGDKKVAGYSRLKVLSFDRLQYLLSGPKSAKPVLSPIGRQMIIHRILRENRSRLKVLDLSADRPGLAAQMAQAVVELHRCDNRPDDIEQLVAQLQKEQKNNLAALKFADIGLVFEQYLKFVEGRFFDPDMQLAAVRCRAGNADFVKGAKLWVDGFAGFTVSELAILAQLLKAAKESKIAFCLDASKIDLKNPDTAKLDPTSLFAPVEQTYVDIAEIVKKCKLELAEAIILDQAVRFSSCPQLAHIERSLFDAKPVKVPAAENIRIVSSPNARAEVRFVAKQILRLVKDKNYRYRDIAVIASDIDGYQHYIKACFDDYRIPFFLDRKKSLFQHPVIGLICLALQTVGNSFSHCDVFAYLKTGLVPIDTGDIDELENYCLAFGLRSNDWQSDKDWCFEDEENPQFDQERINRIRLSIARPLLKLRDELGFGDDSSKNISAEKFTRVIFDFLDSLKVRQTLEEWISEAREKNDAAGVDEHQQLYERLVDIFDELVEVFAGQELGADNFIAIVNSAFSQTELAFIPPTLDQVLVGSIERSRHPNLQAVFLIGTTQKQFPAPVSYSSILTNADRIVAEAADFQLGAASAQKLAERQYLAYIAFTRPSRFLCVTYPLTDTRGSVVVRSQFVTDAELLFDDLGEESTAGQCTEVENIDSNGELADLLCGRCGKAADVRQVNDDSGLEGLLGQVCDDEEFSETGSLVTSAINYNNCAQLDGQIVKDLFDREVNASATRLGTFAACPYQYFARYSLGLQERKESKLKPLDIGNFYHRLLDAVLKRLNKTGKDFATIDDDKLRELVRKEISQLYRENSIISNFIRHSFHNAYIVRYGGEVLENCAVAIGRMVRAGVFRPTLSEAWFGQAGQGIGEYKLKLPDGRQVLVRGIVDRIDIANIDSRKVAMVFDYKRSSKSFSWSRFYNGLDMQLPIYMLAVKNTSQLEIDNVAGAFFMPVEIGTKLADINRLKTIDDKFLHKAKGIFNGEFGVQLDRQVNSGRSDFYNFGISKKDAEYGWYSSSDALRPDDFEKVLEFTEQKIIQMVEEIISGKIEVHPYKLGTETPCGNCVYKPVCRFDWQINDYNFLESPGKIEVLEMIGQTDG